MNDRISRFPSFFFILGWVFFAFLIVNLIIIAFVLLSKLSDNWEKPNLTQGDFAPLLSALHTTWTKIPPNHGPSTELKTFNQFQLQFEEALASIDWQKGLSKPEAKKLHSIAVHVSDASVILSKQLTTDDEDLAKAILNVQTEALKLSNQVGPVSRPLWGQKALALYSEAIKSLAKLVTSWPFVTIIGLILLFAYADQMGGISKIFRGVQSIKIAGVNEIIFSPSQAIDRSKEANVVFASYRDNAKKELAEMSKGEDIARRLQNVCIKSIHKHLHHNMVSYLKDIGKDPDANSDNKKLLEEEFKKHWESLRFTIYVKDLLFEKSLTQLVDYYSVQEQHGKAGRAWSIRYGMIGRVWRLQNSFSEPSVSTNENELVTGWGVTRDEVRNFLAKKRSFTTVVLKDSNEPFALIYMDSDCEDVFKLTRSYKPSGTEGRINELHREILKACKDFNLMDGLRKVANQIEIKKLRIHLYS